MSCARLGELSHAPQTLVQVVDDLRGADGGWTFVDHEGECHLPFPEIRESAFAIGRRLAGMGLRKGDRVVTVMPRQDEFAQAFLGCTCAGLVPVPLYPPLVLGQLDAYLAGVRRVLEATDAAAIVSSSELRDVLAPLADVPFLTFADVTGAGSSGRLPALTGDDTAFLQFTSGSTAEPKGVVVTHAALLANATTIDRHLAIDPTRDRAVSWLPMYHDMGLIGLVITALLAPVPAWYIPPLDFARQPQVWPEWIHRVRGTISFAPNFAYALLAKRARDEDLRRWDLSSWRVAGCGAEPIRAESLAAFADRFAPAGFAPEALLPAYGMAEATLAMALTPVGCGVRTLRVADRELVSCGPAVAGHELRVLGPGGEEQPDGREGEIAFRGPSVTKGYHGDPEATAAAFRDGWLHTGDLGLLRDGELYVTGRIKDLIIVRGRNHHPHDIEACAWDAPGVRTGNVAAFSRPGPDGERLVVVAEARRGADPEALAAGVAERVRDRLGLVVDEVVAVEHGTLPKTTSGKLRRRETRERLLAGSLARVDGEAALAGPPGG
jgi:fatty-acyl-CoA synthase